MKPKKSFCSIKMVGTKCFFLILASVFSLSAAKLRGQVRNRVDLDTESEFGVAIMTDDDEKAEVEVDIETVSSSLESI